MIAQMAQSTDRAADTRYELLDAGVRRRLERFGSRILDRPARGIDAFRLAPEAWADADLRFDPGTGWSGPAWPTEPWPIHVDGLTMELRASSSGGVGLYPEHAGNLAWLDAQVGARGDALPDDDVPTVLNLFAHTGLATLALARSGASVVHVDGARPAVAWAQRNAALSSLADRPVRWIIDDAVAFVAREARRARRYDGIVLDPPAFGRAGRRAWRLADALPDLVAACATVAAEDAFVLLTAHSTGLGGGALERIVRQSFETRHRRIETVRLSLDARSGARLELGWAVRLGT